MKKILILIFLFSIPVLYLCAHNRSFRMTRKISDMEEEKKMLTEQLQQERIEATKAYSYPAIEAKALTLGMSFATTESVNVTNPVLTSVANQETKNSTRCTR